MNKEEFTSLSDVVEVCGTENPTVISSFLRLHDAGFNARKGAESFSLAELDDLYSLVVQLKFDAVDDGGYILGYISTTGGLREQFDVLRVSDTSILNIELKSDFPEGGKEEIERQLARHMLYLKVLNSHSCCVCCYVRSENSLFSIDEHGKLISIDVNVINEWIRASSCDNYLLPDIDLTSMVISPYVEAEKFKNHMYFLTQRQYQARTKALKSLKQKIVITGGAGTGKTLLLLDLAKEYQECGKKVQVIFCGKLENSQEISRQLGICVDPIKDARRTLTEENYDVILIDEAQRLRQNQLDAILNLQHTLVVFSIDRKQVFHPDEEKLSFHCDITVDSRFEIIALTDKIRSNPAMASFITRLLDNKSAKDAVPFDYKDIDVKYFRNVDDAHSFLSWAHDCDHFQVIEPTEYVTKESHNVKHRHQFSGSLGTHDVIGREYDNVLVILDNRYRVTNQGIQVNNGFWYPYKEEWMLFEALTRVKRHLTVVVVDNPEVYKYTQQLLTSNQELSHIQFLKEQNLDKQYGKFLSKQMSKEDAQVCIENIKNSCEEFMHGYNCNRDVLLRILKKILSNVHKV
ncbi:DNA/RNA helicase domain-containing protein [Lacticaseibacillus sp. N501-2]|uniref:DNA/RNA helicase domain-containing protein n=1 Tax=Lacticaseibacillus salsurae TaxID=3367729 RepID=UPI0038B402E1